MARSLILLLSSFILCSYAGSDLISLFPLHNYKQEVTRWISPASKDYNTALMSEAMQKRHLENFHKRYLSPWDKVYVKRMIEQLPPDDIKTVEEEHIHFFSNTKKPSDMIGYGENFKPHSKDWINRIKENIDLNQLTHLQFHKNNRAIAIDNLYARVLPTNDVHFYSHKLAGQGYPFDNLQMSSIWAGTPLYVIAETKDHAWSLVLTPDYIAWVKTSGIARASDFFVMMWVHQTRRQLAAIMRSNVSLLDEEKHYLFSAYVGMVFPATTQGNHLRLTIPVADEHQNAALKYITVSKKNAHLMPLKASPKHFAMLLQTLVKRPYGWGNMYFYNDCSGELKSLYTPFGIWLPRHSSEQVKEGNMVDLSDLSPKKRIEYLKNHGRKLVTIVYINGHVFMYVGNYKNPRAKNSDTMVMTYQNVWGLKPNAAESTKRRAVIGQSVFFPLLLQYPEDMDVKSQASRTYFRISYLDEPSNYVKKPTKVNLRNIMKVED